MEESDGYYPDRKVLLPYPEPEPPPVKPRHDFALTKLGRDMPAISDLPPGFSLNEEQTAAIIEAISEITDVDPFIIERCSLKATELTRLFTKAAAYHNELSDMHEKLKALSTDNKQHMPGQYGCEVNFKSITTDALKLTTTIELYDKRIQRIADSLIARAGMKHG